MIRKAKDRLVSEINEFIQKYGEFSIETYDLNDNNINDWDKIPNVVQIGIDIINFIDATIMENYSDFGYHFAGHADIMRGEVKILIPIANKIRDSEVMDINEFLNQIPTPKVLPDGIDYRKYDEIFDQLKLPSIMFHYIFVCENILRKFIIQVLDDNRYPSVDSIGNLNLSRNINNRKIQESNQKYLPIRGGHDIYYLDLIKLNNIINQVWDPCFIDKFKDQQWIFSRIDSLYTIRNRVAHGSAYLTSDELKSVETYCREIIKQIDQYIR